MKSIQRWWRSPLLVLVTFAVCIAMVAATFISSQVSSRIDTTVNENWRGLYDILVTAQDQNFDSISTGGLVDSQFISTSGSGGISITQLDEIRAISDVEVAAPVGFVGQLRHLAIGPSLWLEDEPASNSSVIEEALIARLNTRLIDTRSPKNRVLHESVGYVALKERVQDPMALALTGAGSGSLGQPIGFTPLETNRQYGITLGQLPSFPTSIIAVDPIAELTLQGEEQAQYLDGLIGLPKSRDLLNEPGPWFNQLNTDKYPVTRAEIDNLQLSAEPAQAVPLVVREPFPDSALISTTVDVLPWKEKTFPKTYEELLRIVEDDSYFHDAQNFSTTVDASALTGTFGQLSLGMLWPESHDHGEDLGVFYETVPEIHPELTGRPVYQQLPPQGKHIPTFRVKPQGITDAAGQNENVTADAYGTIETNGRIQSYRNVEILNENEISPNLPIPVGEFSLEDLIDPRIDDISYVPSGIYDGAITVSQEDGQEILPNFSGVDFITAPPGAFTDLAGGTQLRGVAPIDAIRVRVSGIDNYSEANQIKIAQTAAQIERLGLETFIVAGASVQPVSLFVPEYWVGETNSDLGWVQQDWTTLGAAVISETKLNDINRTFALTVLGVVLLGWIITTLMQSSQGRADIHVLRRIGWRRAQIIWYLAGPHIPSVALVAVTGGILLMRRSALPAPILISMITAAVCISIVAVSMSLAREYRYLKLRSTQHFKTSKLIATTPLALAWRNTVKNRVAGLLTLVSGALLAVITGIFAATFISGMAEAGVTRIALVLRDSTTIPLTALAITGIVTVLVIFTLGLRSTVAAQRRRDRIFQRIGYSLAYRRKIQNAESSIIGVGVIALVGAISVGILYFYPDSSIPALLAFTTALLMTVAYAAATAHGRKTFSSGVWK